MRVEDWLLTPGERENPAARVDRVRPDGTAWSRGTVVRAIVHGAAYFAELHAAVGAMGPGDRLYLTDWRGDPDQRLLPEDAPGGEGEEATLAGMLVAAARRGVDVRGLLWRSHSRHLGFSAEQHRELGLLLEEAGGEVLRDMRVRPGGAHHQKLVVLRHAGRPERDLAYVGGIDLCHGRRDDADHAGDPQPEEVMATAFGPRPAWHDVQIAVRGPAVHDVETTFRERWEDSLPLAQGGRRWSSRARGEDVAPDPLGAQWPPPPAAAPDGAGEHAATVQVLRTFAALRPRGHDFAPQGERSVQAGNAKAIRHARRLVYVEDQYFWSREVGEHFAEALGRSPELRLVVVLPLVPDQSGALARAPQLHGRALAMRAVLEAGGPERVAVFGLTADSGLPVYVHSKTCVIDGRWTSIGSDNLNRRSWTTDSEIACAVLDERAPDVDGLAPRDGFGRTLLRTLVGEHLGCAPEEVPDDPVALVEAMIRSAEALDAWFAGGAQERRTGVRGQVSSALARGVGGGPWWSGPLHLPGGQTRARGRAERDARGLTDRAGAAGERPPGRLRRLDVPQLTRWESLWAPTLYGRVFDPDGRRTSPRARLALR